MDLLERARTLAACPLFESLAPAVVIRLAERAHPIALAGGERRAPGDSVWVVASGTLDVGTVHAHAGNAIGMVRLLRPDAARAEPVAREDAIVLAIAVDDVRDVLEEDPGAVAALAERLAALLMS